MAVSMVALVFRPSWTGRELEPASASHCARIARARRPRNISAPPPGHESMPAASTAQYTSSFSLEAREVIYLDIVNAFR